MYSSGTGPGPLTSQLTIGIGLWLSGEELGFGLGGEGGEGEGEGGGGGGGGEGGGDGSVGERGGGEGGGGDGGGGEGGGEGGGGEGGGGEGEGGGGEGEIHPVHSRMSWSFWLNSWRRRSSRASSCAEHPQVGGERAAKGPESAAPTLPSRQPSTLKAARHLSRRVLGCQFFGWSFLGGWKSSIWLGSRAAGALCLAKEVGCQLSRELPIAEEGLAVGCCRLGVCGAGVVRLV